MKPMNVDVTVQTGLCASCGLCKNMCPKGCISWERSKGKYQPVIDHNQCIHCEICAKICPGLSNHYPEGSEPLQAVYGTYLKAYNAWSREPDLRFVSASGGAVSTLIRELLKSNTYDTAFCVDSYSYDKQLETRAITVEDLQEDWKKSDFPKSRYLPVSHENAVSYLKKNREKRVIIVGTSCAIRGMQNVIEQLGLDREQYLLIGLFCDKVFNYNVYQYFSDIFSEGKKLEAFHFKNKESGGWPGNMKFIFEDGSSAYRDKVEREKVKDYFMPERCLYCIDKLNVEADMSLGDNYTKQNSSSEGSNSVIIRSRRGDDAWNVAAKALEFYPVEMEKIDRAQFLEGRLNNLYFAQLKQDCIQKKLGYDLKINAGVKLFDNYRKYERAWKYNLDKVRAGEVYDKLPDELEKQFVKSGRRKNKRDIRTLCERIYYAVKRRVK